MSSEYTRYCGSLGDEELEGNIDLPFVVNPLCNSGRRIEICPSLFIHYQGVGGEYRYALRCEFPVKELEGNTDISFVVNPLRRSAMQIKELDTNVDNCYFWTDSMIVLGYVTCLWIDVSDGILHEIYDVCRIWNGTFHLIVNVVDKCVKIFVAVRFLDFRRRLAPRLPMDLIQVMYLLFMSDSFEAMQLPARLATFTTRPCAVLISGRNALVTRTTPSTLTSRIRWNCKTEHHSISVKMATPALFTTAHKPVK
ncbi:hypothetical protein MAR_029994 [Mya arenaria]|uniref:Uncharacterized protein n=1 Tax=Mya arenaria TaxID=6604 RepID=A0ABY7DHZ7_MYAAR|nr:hypothetical protein MAR_029994 [Mya arenaria]